MKIAHISSFDFGGAGLAARRLSGALCELGLDSRLVIRYSRGASPGTHLTGGFPLRAAHRVERGLVRTLAGSRSGEFTLSLPLRALGRSDLEGFDLIHLHWNASGFWDPWTLAGMDRPLVLTLHDAWHFTGGCHYFQQCDGYQRDCAPCPRLRAPLVGSVLTRLSQRLKQRLFARDLTCIAPSPWIRRHAEQSRVLRGARFVTIPNGVDLRRFTPWDRIEARRSLGLDGTDPIVLFGVHPASVAWRKGADLLPGIAARIRAALPRVRFVGFGFGEGCPIPGARHLGQVEGERKLSRMYSAADALLFPSREEVCAQVPLESLACGTPVVAIRSRDGADGFQGDGPLPFVGKACPEALARAVEEVLRKPPDRNALREYVRAHHDLLSQASAVKALYEERIAHGTTGGLRKVREGDYVPEGR